MLQHKLKLFARDLSREQCLRVAVDVLALLLDSSYISYQRPRCSGCCAGSAATALQTLAPTRPSRAFRYYSLVDLFAAIPREIESEDPVEVCWTSQHVGMAQRAYGVVITGVPMILHRDARTRNLSSGPRSSSPDRSGARCYRPCDRRQRSGSSLPRCRAGRQGVSVAA